MLAFLQDELKVLLAGKPTIRQDIAKLDSIHHTGRYHPSHQLIFGDLTGSLDLVSLHITDRKEPERDSGVAVRIGIDDFEGIEAESGQERLSSETGANQSG